MKFYNSNTGRAKLRRDNFKNSQNKSQFNGKKSLTKRIIEERVDGITADNVERELKRMACEVRSNELVQEIIYHLNFGANTRPSIFNAEKLEATMAELCKLRYECNKGLIDVERYVEILEDMDEHITNLLNDWSQSI